MELSQHTVLGEWNLRLAARQVDGVDIDVNSIKAARDLLSRFDVGKSWSLEIANLLDLPAQSYDVVYSGASSITPAQCGAHLSM